MKLPTPSVPPPEALYASVQRQSRTEACKDECCACVCTHLSTVSKTDKGSKRRKGEKKRNI